MKRGFDADTVYARTTLVDVGMDATSSVIRINYGGLSNSILSFARIGPVQISPVPSVKRPLN